MMNPSRRFLTQIILLVATFGLAVVLYFGLRALAKSDPPPQPPTAVTIVKSQPVVSAGIPTRLKIPKIGVDAVVELMGLTPDGDMEAPSGAKTVGWYKHGANPGNVGSAVMDGHYGTWVNGETSVFDNLNQLVVGDSLIVEDEKGVLVTFIVRELRMFAKNEDASVVFRSSDGKAHLNLITCQGDWIKSQDTFSGRLVVFADKQSD